MPARRWERAGDAPGNGNRKAVQPLSPEPVLKNSKNLHGETRWLGMENICKRYLQKLEEIKYNTTFMSQKRFHYSACLKIQSIFKVCIYIRLDCALKKKIITSEFG